VLGRPERVPAMSFLDLTGYTHLTEQQGDATAAALAETLAVLVNRSSREHGGVPVKLALVSGAVIPQSVAAFGAVLSSDDYGSSVERTATLHPFWKAPLEPAPATSGEDTSQCR